MRKGHVAREGGRRFPNWIKLGQLGGEKGKKEGKKKRRGMRSSTLSLGFTKVGLSVFVGARGKVHLHDETFEWGEESGVFTELREVGVSLLPWLFLV